MTDKISTPALLLMALIAAASATACTDDDQPSSDAGITANADAAPVTDVGVTAPDATEPDATIEEDAGLADTGEPPAPPDAGMADPCLRNDAGRCAAVTWTSTTGTYPVAVDHHTTYVTEGQGRAYLNVAGGILTDVQGSAEEVYDGVRRAEILAGGSVGAWEDTTTLPFPLAFHAIAQHERHVYFLAGVTSDAQGPAASVAVLWADIDDTGTITEWKRGPALPREVRLHASAQVVNGRLYLVGGAGSQDVVDKVNFTVLDPVTGAPTTWIDGPALPAPRSHHATVLFGGQIYVLAGFDESQRAAPAIWRSSTGEDGAISAWEQVGEMAQAPWTASSFVHRNYVFIVGGGTGSGFAARFIDRVRMAPFLPDFTVGEFEDVDEKLPIARSHVHQTPIHDGRVYSVGGRELNPELTSINNVFIGSLW
jgi:hypothetical protein